MMLDCRRSFATRVLTLPSLAVFVKEKMEEQNPAHEEAVPQPTPPRAGGDGRPPKSPSSTNPKEPGLDQLHSFFGNGSNNVGPRMEQPGLRNRRGSHGTRKLRHRRQVSRLQEFTNPLATTDTALLLASLDKENEAVEDEAEAVSANFQIHSQS